jgi:IclR family transcriptional regulator, KDG regulon repressor
MVQRVVRVLEDVAGSDLPKTQIEIARSTGLAKSTCADILGALRHIGYVELVDRRYKPGPQLIALGNAATKLDQLRARLRGTLESLARETEETVVVYVETGATETTAGSLVVIDFVESRHEIRFVPRLGLRPFLPTSSGRLFLAFTGRDTSNVSAAVKKALRVSLREMNDAIARVRASGYALSIDDTPGLTSLAGPVFDREGAIVATISIVGPSERMSDAEERLLPHLREALRAVNETHGSPALPASSPG